LLLLLPPQQLALPGDLADVLLLLLLLILPGDVGDLGDLGEPGADLLLTRVTLLVAVL
jgi:hypothetical protein